MIETLPKPYTNGQARKTTNPDELDTLLRECRIDPSREYPDPSALLTIAGGAALTEGSISVVKGAKKSRKSFFAAHVVARILQPNSPFFADELLAVPDHKPSDCVAIYDTEQGISYTARSARRIGEMIGSEAHERLHVFDLKPHRHKLRRSLISRHIETTPNLRLVVIDGIRDLVADFNDPTEANDVIEWLLGITARNRVHVMVVIHVNKGDSNARGHLGAEVENKAETVFEVTLNDGWKGATTVSAPFTRGTGFDDFALRIVDGLPVVDSDTPARQDRQRGRPKAREIHDMTFHDMARITAATFAGAESLSASQLRDRLANAMIQTFPDEECGTARAGRIAEGLSTHGFVIATGNKTRKNYTPNIERIEATIGEQADGKP